MRALSERHEQGRVMIFPEDYRHTLQIGNA
jgi:hypothetical protein